MANLRCLALLACMLLTALAAFSQQQVPRFEPADCALPVPQGETNVRCGNLIVRENRSVKNGKTITLPIVILKSTSATPKPDPVLKTLGGPGGSSLKMIRGRRSSPWLADRDYIIFEQRGTKYARPSLECPEIDASRADSAKKQLNRAASKSAEIAGAAKCFARLKAAGVDLDAYNSAESAADIEDLRTALKLDKINLYGVSYSARLMLDVMRYFPNGVRSVVLESTMPPEINYDEVGVDAMVRSLNELFTSCQTDKDCATAYPDLETEFYAVVSRLNSEPLVSSVTDPTTKQNVDIKLDGFDFATWIVDYLFSNEPSATVEAPYVIHKAFARDYVPQFGNYASDKLGGSFYSWGMRYSVWCSEERPFENGDLIKAQSTKYKGLLGYEVMAVPDICRVWRVKPAKSIANTPVTSSIPTLVLAAQYDAYTDPAWARSVAARIKDSHFVEIPWAGHGPAFSVPCVSNMVAAFVDDPKGVPSNDCATKTEFKFLIKTP
jgi:pimeloyl-ACP methyl ester carboxylesterase